MIGIPFFIKNKPRLSITNGTALDDIGCEKIMTFPSFGPDRSVYAIVSGIGYAQVLVVAGGGSGGGGDSDVADYYAGDGGRGGEVIYQEKVLIATNGISGSILSPVKTGGYGAGGVGTKAGILGGTSSIFGLTATPLGALGGNGPAHPSGSGKNDGAAGFTSSISGTEICYGCGGGSGLAIVSGTGSGGTSIGGGIGGGATNSYANNGTAGITYGSGGGGGACVYSDSPNTITYGGNGKQGIVIVRYIP